MTENQIKIIRRALEQSQGWLKLMFLATSDQVIDDCETLVDLGYMEKLFKAPSCNDTVYIWLKTTFRLS